MRIAITTQSYTGLEVIAYSATTSIVPPYAKVGPEISGTLQDTHTIATDGGSWPGSPNLAYAWQYCDGTPIPGATSSSYTLRTSDIGYSLRVVVTATKSGAVGTSESSCTSTIGAANPSINVGLPSISFDGSVLFSSDGSWGGDPASSTAYQWRWSDWASGSGGHGLCATSYVSGSAWHIAGTGQNQSFASYPCWVVEVTKSNSGGGAMARSPIKQTRS